MLRTTFSSGQRSAGESARNSQFAKIQHFPDFSACILNLTMAFSTGIAARAFSTTYARNAIKNVVVIGGGLMGSGIAQVGVTFGFAIV